MSRNFQLAVELAQRELASRYKRSMMGLVWLIVTPLCLLGIYSLIFGRVFGIQWTHPVHSNSENGIGFTLPFFVGLSVYLYLSDLVNSSASLFVSKRTFVIKSPFPLWVLWLSNLLRSSFQGSVYLLLALLLAVVQGRLSLAGLGWMFIGIGSLSLFAAALSLLLCSLGPFVGDIAEAIRLLLRVLFYATPITYPLSLIDERWQPWLWLNPLTNLIEPLRSAIVFGEGPSLQQSLVFAICSSLLLALAVWVFVRVKGHVADVV